jgi:hypothetical protein
MKPIESIIPSERIDGSIYHFRVHKVMLSNDLAALYGVQVRSLNQAVSRNKSRFPDDFMFQLSHEEFKILKSQIMISSWGGSRARPYAFTEQGVAMLRSERAVQVNIEIMRAFVRLREVLSSNMDVNERIEELELRYDGKFRVVFDAIDQLKQTPAKENQRIGFRV